MAANRVLLVEDNDDVRTMYQQGLETHGFSVVPAASVNQALALIVTQQFDVLLSDLHMPDAGDGFTVVSAMRHAHPKAITLVLSGYPAVQEAMAAIVLQADEVLVKPLGLAAIVDLIHNRLANPSVQKPAVRERVSAILKRDSLLTINHWMSTVELNPELMSLALTSEQRTGHLPLLLDDLAYRMCRAPEDRFPISEAARKHGALRRKQGYTVAMLVEESRILQASIFNTVHNNMGTIAFSTVLLDVMTIAEEVSFQLKEAALGFMDQSAPSQLDPLAASLP